MCIRDRSTGIAWGFQTCGAACEDSIPLGLATQIHGGFHRSQHEMGQHAMHRVLKVYASQDHNTPSNVHFPEQSIETASSFLKQYNNTGLCGMYLVARPCMTSPNDAGSVQEIWQYTMADWCRMTQKMMHQQELDQAKAVSYTHLRAHETVLDLVCRLLLEKKKKNNRNDVVRKIEN
eukprot:TRINITY_DN1704_c0_g1_i3.p1 TRINITY_DN1704_c0_g1~~TRINITY_DN1704_c0_g1_i3.p1  ORF type:complete len:177 (-),score=96.02 TRINITY_DN1704_c0_g1_i3:67-597(-)